MSVMILGLSAPGWYPLHHSSISELSWAGVHQQRRLIHRCSRGWFAFPSSRKDQASLALCLSLLSLSLILIVSGSRRYVYEGARGPLWLLERDRDETGARRRRRRRSREVEGKDKNKKKVLESSIVVVAYTKGRLRRWRSE